MNADNNNNSNDEFLSAIFRGNRADVKGFLAKRRPDFRTSDGWTPLNAALCGGHAAIALDILSHGRSYRLINEPCISCGYTPIGRAIKSDLGEVVECLVAHRGIDLDAWSFLPAPANIAATPLLVASEMNAVSSIEVLLARGADGRLGKDNGCTPLHHAVLFGAVEATGLLLQHDASLVGAECPDCKGDPLYVAANNPRNEPAEKMNTIADLLLEHGAKPRFCCQHNLTPINWAVYSANVPMLRMFAVRGCRNPPGALGLRRSFLAGTRYLALSPDDLREIDTLIRCLE